MRHRAERANGGEPPPLCCRERRGGLTYVSQSAVFPLHRRQNEHFNIPTQGWPVCSQSRFHRALHGARKRCGNVRHAPSVIALWWRALCDPTLIGSLCGIVGSPMPSSCSGFPVHFVPLAVGPDTWRTKKDNTQHSNPHAHARAHTIMNRNTHSNPNNCNRHHGRRRNKNKS